MNNWMITGRLTKDPQTIGTQTGNLLTKIYIAVRRDFRDKQTNEYESDFYLFKAFGKTADYIYKHVKKGDLVEIQGRPTNNNFEKDGEKIYRDDYIIQSISRLSAKKEVN